MNHLKNQEKPNSKICISIDVDWSPKELLQDTLQLLDEYGVKATIFCTDNVEKEEFNLLKNHEIGIHPNITSVETVEEKIKALKKMFPESKCIRNHCLIHNTKFNEIYKKNGLTFSSNYFHFMQAEIKKLNMPSGITEIPVFFMDDLYLNMNQEKIKNINECQSLFSISNINLNSFGLKVFDFHPIHIFMNTNSLKFYDSIKKDYHNYKKLKKKVVTKSKGIRNIFIELLEFIRSNKINTHFITKL